MPQSVSLKRTPLHAVHVSLGARMVDFGGWEMPVQYSGLVDEHHAVRHAVGLFDVSHMGEIEIRGGGGGPAPADPTTPIKDDVKNDLNKKPCYQLLGFTSADAAQKFLATITYNEQHNGNLQLARGAPAAGTPAPAQTLGFGTINLNMDYNWGDFSQVTTSRGGTYDYLGYINRMYGTSMTSEQFGTLLIIHELFHQFTVPNYSNDETIKAKKKIYNDCIK
jgi:hypothetical protein